MDIKADFERVRNLINTLQNWDLIVKEKRLDAIWGHSSGIENTKVQTTRKNDSMEYSIIELQELEERRSAIFAQYWDEKTMLSDLVYKYADVDDIRILHNYLVGCELSEIPLRKQQKNPLNAVNAAIKRLQATIDREAEIARQSEVIQSLIRGGEKKCKRCSEGYIKYSKEEPDKFIFVCTGCGRRLKADKIGERIK